MPREYLSRSARFLSVASPVLLLWTAPADIGMCLIAVLFLVHSGITRDWRWCREGWVQILGALWLCMVARGLFAADIHSALARALPFGRYIIFAAALARWTLQHPQTRRRFSWVLSATVLFIAADSLLQYLTGFDVFLHRILYGTLGGHMRLDGPFSRPIVGIMMTWLIFPALLPLLLSETGMPQKGRKLVGGLLYLMLGMAVIVLSGERMALLLVLLGWAITALLLPLKKRLLLPAAGGILLLLGLLALANPMVLHRQISSTTETLEHWQESPYGLIFASDMALAKQHPLTGLGAGQFTSACKALYNDQLSIDTKCSTHPHNIYLEWLIDEGMLGLGLFVAFIATACARCMKAWPHQRHNPLFIGLLVAFIFRIWPLMSSTGFHSRWGEPPFWLVLGALLVYTGTQPEQKQNADSSVAV